MKLPREPMQTFWDSCCKYLLATVFIFIPLYPKFPLFTVPFTYVAIRAEDFLIALCWIIFLIRYVVLRDYKLPKITLHFLVFFLAIFLSSLSAILITKNIQPSLVMLHFLRRLEYMSLFFLVIIAGRSIDSRRYFFDLIIIPAIGVLLYGLAQIYLGAPVISTMDAESSKGIALVLRPGVTLNSTFAGHYDLAVYLTMVLTALASYMSSVISWKKRLIPLVVYCSLAWLFVQAGSRISLLGIIISLSLVTLIYRRYSLGLLFVTIITALTITSPQYIGRFRSILDILSRTSETIDQVHASEDQEINVKVDTATKVTKDISSSIRFDVEWPRAIRAFYKNPLLGTGYSSISLATDNDYLRSLGETGILGFTSFIALLIAIGRYLFSQTQITTGIDQVISVSAVGIFTSFLVAAVFIDVFESSKIASLFWAQMGLAFSTKYK